MKKNEIQEIRFVPNGFTNDKSFTVYYFKFNDGKIYIGKTGTSNKTGKSSVYQRLGSHLKKTGKTKSVIWDNLNEADRMQGFVFGFVQSLSDSDAEKIEIHLINQPILKGKLLNQNKKIKKILKENEEEDLYCIANELLKKIIHPHPLP